eukprot:tig00020995_g16918.t1
MYEYAEAAGTRLVAPFFLSFATLCNQVLLSLLLSCFLEALRTVYEVSAAVAGGPGQGPGPPGRPGPAPEPRVTAYDVRRVVRWERVAFDAELEAMGHDEARALSQLCGIDLLALRRAKAADAPASSSALRHRPPPGAASDVPAAPSRALSRTVSFSRSEWGSFYRAPSDAAIAQARTPAPLLLPPITAAPQEALDEAALVGAGGALARAAAAVIAEEAAAARVCVNIFPGDLIGGVGSPRGWAPWARPFPARPARPAPLAPRARTPPPPAPASLAGPPPVAGGAAGAPQSRATTPPTAPAPFAGTSPTMGLIGASFAGQLQPSATNSRQGPPTPPPVRL